MARPLMTIDELKRLPLDTSIVMVKGMRPIKAKKYDVSMHPMDKERMKCKLDHNDPSLNHRKEWKILNPYELNTSSSPSSNGFGGNNNTKDEDIEDIQKQLEAKFDELFGSLSEA